MPETSFPKSKIKVLLLENIHDTAREIFRNGGLNVEVLAGSLSDDELVDKIRDVHLVGVRSKTQLSRNILEHATRLRAIGCFCIGTNQVDLPYAKSLGIPVFNAPFSNTRSVAELVISEIIALSRRLGDCVRNMHDGVWQKSAVGSFEVRGKTLGIIGYGRIGRQVGVLAESMGMLVQFHDIAAELPMGNNRPAASLNAVLETSDFVTLHVPATPETTGMMTSARIRKMRRGSYLLNLSRGGVVDIDALAVALGDGHIAGAAIDVYPEEPRKNGPGFKSPLRGLPNVILTPHIGGSTEEAQQSIGREVGQRLLKFLNAGITNGAVNFPHIGAPLVEGCHRILNVHRNVPGVLSEINSIVSSVEANVSGQILATDDSIGYLVMDIDQRVSNEVRKQVNALSTTIRTRILY